MIKEYIDTSTYEYDVYKTFLTNLARITNITTREGYMKYCPCVLSSTVYNSIKYIPISLLNNELIDDNASKLLTLPKYNIVNKSIVACLNKLSESIYKTSGSFPNLDLRVSSGCLMTYDFTPLLITVYKRNLEEPKIPLKDLYTSKYVNSFTYILSRQLLINKQLTKTRNFILNKLTLVDKVYPYYNRSVNVQWEFNDDVIDNCVRYIKAPSINDEDITKTIQYRQEEFFA